MRLLPVSFLSLLSLLGCQMSNTMIEEPIPVLYKSVGAIPPPAGFTMQAVDSGSYAFWLRTLSLKEDKRVYLFDGSLKRNQQAQFAVIDISIGDKDLQQCADAVIRLRAEYLYSQRRYNEIVFKATSGQQLSYARWKSGERFRLKGNRLEAYSITPVNKDKQKDFTAYLEFVFMYAGTLSLERQLQKKNDYSTIQAGDVLLKGGSPGHAMQVMNIAVNEKGEKAYLLAQSYMPAQSVHIVKNPAADKVGAWYIIDKAENAIITPEWRFTKDQLYRW